MFKCIYKADMTEQQINMQKKSQARQVPCERHLGLTEPITTKDVIWLKATCSSVKALKSQIINYKHMNYKKRNNEITREVHIFQPPSNFRPPPLTKFLVIKRILTNFCPPPFLDQKQLYFMENIVTTKIKYLSTNFSVICTYFDKLSKVKWPGH